MRPQLVDGWEMTGELWPSPSDHGRPVRERTVELCGSAPARPFVSEQNAMLLQYRLPAAGSALSLRVRHLPNPRRESHHHRQMAASGTCPTPDVSHITTRRWPRPAPAQPQT